jgi:hypothetical protein
MSLTICQARFCFPVYFHRISCKKDVMMKNMKKMQEKICRIKKKYYLCNRI